MMMKPESTMSKGCSGAGSYTRAYPAWPTSLPLSVLSQFLSFHDHSQPRSLPVSVWNVSQAVFSPGGPLSKFLVYE